MPLRVEPPDDAQDLQECDLRHRRAIRKLDVTRNPEGYVVVSVNYGELAPRLNEVVARAEELLPYGDYKLRSLEIPGLNFVAVHLADETSDLFFPVLPSGASQTTYRRAYARRRNWPRHCGMPPCRYSGTDTDTQAKGLQIINTPSWLWRDDDARRDRRSVEIIEAGQLASQITRAISSQVAISIVREDRIPLP